MRKLLKYIFLDILRTKVILLYFTFLLIMSFTMYQLDSDTGKVILSMLTILLLIVPLVSIVFSTIHFYNSYEFIELMLAQPINRTSVFFSQFLAVSTSLTLAFIAGVGIPVLIYGIDSNSFTLLYSGALLTFVFVALSFLGSVITRDKAKAIGLSLLIWFFFSLIYDAFLLWVVYNLAEYPIEKPLLALIALNPIDIARVLMLLKLDISALMGYTGAFYKQFFGNFTGIMVAVLVLLIWIALPTLVAYKRFLKKDI